jgi:hypothetical protein
MMRSTLALLALAAGLGAVAAADEPVGPPRVLVVTREEIKPGMMGPHSRSAASYVSVATRANAPNYRIGLTPLSGDENTVVYLEPHPSFAAYEAARNAFEGAIQANAALKTEMDSVDRDGSMHQSQRTAIYRYRPDLSYRPGRMEDVARARYMTMATTRIKPGRGIDYVAYLKGQIAAREKANIDTHTAVYQSVSGAAPNTFVVFSTARSLAEWDDITARLDADQKAMETALGGPEAARLQRMILADVIADSTVATYAMTPEISRPMPQFLAYDAAFWAPRAAAAGGGKALATKKETKPQAKQ